MDVARDACAPRIGPARRRAVAAISPRQRDAIARARPIACLSFDVEGARTVQPNAAATLHWGPGGRKGVHREIHFHLLLALHAAFDASRVSHGLSPFQSGLSARAGFSKRFPNWPTVACAAAAHTHEHPTNAGGALSPEDWARPRDIVHVCPTARRVDRVDEAHLRNAARREHACSTAPQKGKRCEGPADVHAMLKMARARGRRRWGPLCDLLWRGSQRGDESKFD